MPLKRREFIRQCSAAAAALLAFPPASLRSSSSVRRHADTPKRIIIMGAGMAGLSAGYELMRAGHDVVILEARDRPGGRVRTLRGDFTGRLFAEAGASRIADNHKEVLSYVKEFDLPLTPFRPGGLSSVYHIGGKRLNVKRGDRIRWPLELSEAEQKLGLSGMRDAYVTAILKDSDGGNQWPPERLKKYDLMSWTEFLKHRGASPGAVRLLTLGHNAAIVDGVSALFWLHYAAAALTRSRFYAIAGGNDLLPGALADRLRNRLLYSSPVVSIEHGEDAMEVTCMQQGSRHVLRGDYLLCTVPFSVLRDIPVSPPFSDRKAGVIRSLQYVSAAKVFMEMKRRFWADEHADGFAVTDLPIGELWDGSFNQPGRAGILVAYTTGGHARELCALPATERLASALKQTERVYPGAGDQCSGGTSVCWDEEAWSRGGWAVYRPGEAVGLPRIAAEPEGRVFFAGDHVSDLPGWMEGAIASGKRAVAAIHRRINRLE